MKPQGLLAIPTIRAIVERAAADCARVADTFLAEEVERLLADLGVGGDPK